MDMSETIVPKSDQQNFDDYLVGPRTVSISGVTKGSAEQPVNVELAEYPGKPYKPNKSMRRVLVTAWGADSSAYVGRRLTLVGNPNVSYGGKAVGGIEIAAMSHLSKRLTLSLTETRGKKRSFTVEPLPEVVRRDFLAESEAIGHDEQRLRTLWLEAKNAGEPSQVLDAIREAATLTPAPDAAPAA